MATIKIMVCVDCSMRIETTIPKAKRAGWSVWVGGSRCKVCCEKEQGPNEHTIPPSVAVAISTLGAVKCSECSRVFPKSNEYMDGWHPSIHWIKPTEEQRIAARSGREPLPLCPGWNRAGLVALGENEANAIEGMARS